jgi:hypothetical protein
MHHTRAAVTLVAALVLGVTGCTSSEGGGGTDTSTSPSASVSGLSSEWIPKLEEATEGRSGVCAEVGDQACAEHLTDIALVVSDLESAIQDAGAEEAYPRSMKEIEKINKAVDAYTEHECLGDPNAGIDGSPCPKDTYTIMGGGTSLQFTMTTDELKAA